MKERFEAKEGVVIDNNTGLMWMQNPLDKLFTWDEACEVKHEFEGFDDWRVPTIEELTGIIDYKKSDSTCNDVFRFGKYSVFWSSSPKVGNTNYAWYVNFSYGYVYYNRRVNAFQVRLVRG